MPLDAAGVHARLRDRFGEAIGDLAGTGRDASCSVEPARIAEVCRFLRTEPALRFDCLSNLSGVDYPKRSAGSVRRNWHTSAMRAGSTEQLASRPVPARSPMASPNRSRSRACTPAASRGI